MSDTIEKRKDKADYDSFQYGNLSGQWPSKWIPDKNLTCPFSELISLTCLIRLEIWDIIFISNTKIDIFYIECIFQKNEFILFSWKINDIEDKLHIQDSLMNCHPNLHPKQLSWRKKFHFNQSFVYHNLWHLVNRSAFSPQMFLVDDTSLSIWRNPPWNGLPIDIIFS